MKQGTSSPVLMSLSGRGFASTDQESLTPDKTTENQTTTKNGPRPYGEFVKYNM